jgi:rubrerythrin
MTGTSFFRSGEGKCPNCGTFGQEHDEQEDGKVCPLCNAVFNKYIMLEQGKDIELQNN